ncbi:MAG TPA: CUAEP/CCAEP-tail radical SAM protein [Bryobacterales bacterium]|jgi:radical SAM superfamily enzyme YgiQ (UPF0313 family)|nr:CUAEP/CCAEP-tail radical SAM protein [Bryobacterales bacterium]
MKVVLISTYEMGRQPFGLASPAAWLKRAGAEVSCCDVSRQPLDEAAVQAADLVAFYIPMHTATRLAVRLAPRVRSLNPRAHLCFYGLYAPVNEEFLRELGAGTILGGEFEPELVALAERLEAGRAGPQQEPRISLERFHFVTPDRSGLPPPGEYARLIVPGRGRRIAGYTEASRGCKHFCRHCPIVPIYGGHFRVVDREVVLEDIRRQVAAGARHITFGDPDFFNGIGHSVAIVRRLHEEFPDLSYDVTIKIEHLLKHRGHLATLRDTGCLFVTSAVESVDDRVLALLDKGHTRQDFLEAVRLCREASLTLAPTFVAFTPWTTLETYRALLACIAELDLIPNVAPIQLAIRLLIPAGSRLLERPEVLSIIGEFDHAALTYRWIHPDPRMDELCSQIQSLVKRREAQRATRRAIFREIWRLAHQHSCPPHDGETGFRRRELQTELGGGKGPEAARAIQPPDDRDRIDRAAIPYINEPWYC